MRNHLAIQTSSWSEMAKQLFPVTSAVGSIFAPLESFFRGGRQLHFPNKIEPTSSANTVYILRAALK